MLHESLNNKIIINSNRQTGGNTSAFRLAVINVCPVFVLRVTSEYSFTVLGRMDS